MDVPVAAAVFEGMRDPSPQAAFATEEALRQMSREQLTMRLLELFQRVGTLSDENFELRRKASAQNTGRVRVTVVRQLVAEYEKSRRLAETKLKALTTTLSESNILVQSLKHELSQERSKRNLELTRAKMLEVPSLRMRRAAPPKRATRAPFARAPLPAHECQLD